MQYYEIKKIVQEYLLERLDEYTIQSSMPRQRTSQIAIYPGAPFGGNLSLVMNNQARHKLRQWGRFAKACEQKYGEPGKWPEEMQTIAKTLGTQVEQATQPENLVEDDAPTGKLSPRDQAHKLGLTYKGHGVWKDSTGKSVAKTVDGNLVRLDADGKVPQAPDPQPDVFNDPNPIDDAKLKKKLDKETLKKLIQMVLDRDDLDVDPTIDKQLAQTFKEAGMEDYDPEGLNHVSPRWNAGMNTKDIPYDANGEETVQKLLAMIKDPLRLLRWLVKKLKTETTNGKQRILQYIGILFDLGVLPTEDVKDVDVPPGVQ